MGKDTYLVIGGSGFIGRHIVQMLLARGDSVSVLDIVQRYHDTPFYSADISNQAQVEEALIKVCSYIYINVFCFLNGSPISLALHVLYIPLHLLTDSIQLYIGKSMSRVPKQLLVLLSLRV